MGISKETFADITFNILSWTSAMDAWSFSLPAGKAGSCVYEAGDICGSCYAKINLYNMPNVVRTQWGRYLWTKHEVENNLSGWVDKMVGVIDKTVDNNYFRIHDSGDFYHPNYIWAWYYICKSLQHIQFWAPTRVWQTKHINWIAPLRRLAMLPNVAIRPSALNLDELEWSYKFLADPTAVVTTKESSEFLQTKLCPKTENHSSCQKEGCRSCWNKDISISYLIHGPRGKNEVFKVSERLENKRRMVAAQYTELTINGK